jgi:integrase/recombinase XerC
LAGPYAGRTKRPPRSLTDRELARVLKVSGQHREGFRDHVLISIAVGTGLRESEIVGLDVGDVLTEAGGVREVIQLRIFKRAGRGADPRAQRVHLPASTYWKLEKYARVEQLATYYRNAPLFWSRLGNRLSTRAVRGLWRRWQGEAGIDHPYPFHALRHTAITNCRRATGDISIASAFARHARQSTTEIYNHVSDAELANAVRDMPG